MKTIPSSSLRFGGALFVAGLALLVTGCATNVNTYERAESQAAPNYVADKRVITDNTLAGTFRVVSINQGTVSGNLLKIQATVENLKSKLRTLNYKFEWVDADGMALDSANETWKAIQLQGRETQTISTVAISPRAVDFRLKFRE
ncbi:MAG: YcfL family protein [Opitutaceae bacterium]|nr:YcfL family protein [Opitutaceae bacterium]MBP9913262.1 YcfL family protein [Opitutaceae bacterium]